MWIEFRSSSIWLRRFFSGYSGFPTSSNIDSQSNYIWLGLRRSGITRGSYGGSRTRAARSHAFGPIPSSRLILKSPCRERSTKHIYIYIYIMKTMLMPLSTTTTTIMMMMMMTMITMCITWQSFFNLWLFEPRWPHTTQTFLRRHCQACRNLFFFCWIK